MEQCAGGVARNIAEALWRLQNGRTKLLTAIGDDADGMFLQNVVPGLILDGCILRGQRTASYSAVFDRNGECTLGMGDMDIHNNISKELVDMHYEVMMNAPLVVIDGNIPQNTMDYILQKCYQLKKRVFFEPTDRRKAIRPLNKRHQLTYASPNLTELKEMAYQLSEPHDNKKTYLLENNEFAEIVNLTQHLSKSVNNIIITMGSKGVIIISRDYTKSKLNETLILRFYQTSPIENVENVSGAGDCFASGFIFGVLLNLTEAECVTLGFTSARNALHCKTTVPATLEIPKCINGAECKVFHFKC